MQIDESEAHFSKAWSSIDKSLESDSNVTVERAADVEKAYPASLSTDEGMEMDESDRQL
jgi:hypothetical protein